MKKFLVEHFGKQFVFVQEPQCPTCHAPGVRPGERITLHKNGAKCDPETLAVLVNVRVPVVNESKLRYYR